MATTPTSTRVCHRTHQEGTETPTIEVNISGDKGLTAEQAQECADALRDAVTILRVIEREGVSTSK